MTSVFVFWGVVINIVLFKTSGLRQLAVRCSSICDLFVTQIIAGKWTIGHQCATFNVDSTKYLRNLTFRASSSLHFTPDSLLLYARRNARANQELAAGTVHDYSRSSEHVELNSFDASHQSIRSIRSTPYVILDQSIRDMALFFSFYFLDAHQDSYSSYRGFQRGKTRLYVRNNNLLFRSIYRPRVLWIW